MTNTENLFELVYMLMDKKQMTARELASHFGVSARTVYRWVDSLSIAGIPVYAAKGSGGGIRIDEAYALDKTVLTEEEKQSVVASLNALQALTGAESSAAKKLRSLSSRNADWLEVDFGTWNPLGRYVKTVFDVLKDAILHGTIVTFDYFSTEGHTLRRTFHPWKIVFRGQAWYAFGWCELRREERYFKLSRIQHIVDTHRPSSVQPRKRSAAERSLDDGYAGTEMDEYSAPVIPLTAKVRSSAVYRIMDEFFVEKVQTLSSEETVVTVQIPDSYWLDSWILSFGTEMEILEPRSVRERIARIVEQMHERM